MPAGRTSEDLPALFPRGLLVDSGGNDRVTWSGGFEFLGAPIGNQAFCESHAAGRVQQAKSLLTTISELPDPQVGLRLIRVCAGFCRLVYSARVVSPDAHRDSLRQFDELTRNSVCDLLGLDLTDRQWAQVGRSFRTAGLGLRSSERHAACAYMASRAATKDKCLEIDPHFIWNIDTDGSDAARALRALSAALPPDTGLTPQDPRLASQRTLSRLLDESELAAHLATADPAEAANLHSETLWGANGFLSATPSKALGLAMDPNEFIEEIRVRLWIPTYPHDDFCPCCDAISDRMGLHSRRCGAAGDWTACHHAARNITSRFADAAGLNTTIEQPHLLPPRPDDPSGSNLRRPADVYAPSWTHGQPAAFDLAITSPQRQETLSQASLGAGHAASQYKGHKRTHLGTEEDCRRQGILFVPLVAESSGGWGPSAMATFTRWAKLATGRGVQPASPKAILPQYLESLCVAIRSAKARAVLRRGGGTHNTAAQTLDAARLFWGLPSFLVVDLRRLLSGF